MLMEEHKRMAGQGDKTVDPGLRRVQGRIAWDGSGMRSTR
jgi:hypothetical protein